MKLGPTNPFTINEIDELIRQKVFWYESNERFVIVEKFESMSYRNVYRDGIMQEMFTNKNGELHRNNGNPSCISRDMLSWHKNGNVHRNNGKPAIIRNSTQHPLYGDELGTPIEEYLVNGDFHRDFDLPAVVFGDINLHSYWFKNGKIHRDNNKPSIINGNFLHYHNNGELYKSEITYNNKLLNWIMRNPFKVSGILFIIIMLIIFFY